MSDVFDDGYEGEDDARSKRFSARYLDTVEYLDRFLRVRGWIAVRTFDRNDRRPGYQWEWAPTRVRPWVFPTTVMVWDNLPMYAIDYARTDWREENVREEYETLYELMDRLQMVESWPSIPDFDTSERSAFIRRLQAAAAANQHTEAFPIAERFAVRLNALRAQFRNGEIGAPTHDLETLRITADAYMAHRGAMHEQEETDAPPDPRPLDQ